MKSGQRSKVFGLNGSPQVSGRLFKGVLLGVIFYVMPRFSSVLSTILVGDG